MRFVTCPIDRAASISLRKDPQALQEVRHSAVARFILIHSRQVLLVCSENGARVYWRTWKEVLDLTRHADEHALYFGPFHGAADGPAPGCHAFTIDLSPLVAEEDVLAASPESARLRWCTGRELLRSDAPDSDVTVAGMALAMTNWHLLAQFEGSSGIRTEPIEGGAKRQVHGNGADGPKVYPRTDPVAIGLIVSPDGSQCLLGHGHTHAEGMYTCLAGFVDQCESVEEALRREAVEEVGVRLGRVELAASQPWPISRAGPCELMIGCRAVALDEDLKVNHTELQDARWFEKDELRQMLRGWHPEGLTVPGPFAIAHHLIRDFVAQPRAAAARPRALSGLGPPATLCLCGVAVGLLLARFQSLL